VDRKRRLQAELSLLDKVLSTALVSYCYLSSTLNLDDPHFAKDNIYKRQVTTEPYTTQQVAEMRIANHTP